MDEQVKLPSSSYEEVCKIIAGYARLDKEISLDEISRITGMHRTAVSGNNGFLTTVGIVEGGNRKTVTPLGKQLGLAIEHQLEDDIAQGWRSIISGSNFLRNLISSIRIRRGMEIGSLRAHVAYSAGLAKTKSIMTGTGTVIEILKVAGALKEHEGKLIATDSEEPFTSTPSTHGEPSVYSSSISNTSAITDISSKARIEGTVSTGGTPTYQVRIQLNVACSPDQLEEVGSKLKKLLRELNSSEVDIE